MDTMRKTHSSAKSYALIQEEAEAWWMKLRSGKATSDDAQALRQWCAQSAEHAAAWREIRDAWTTLAPVAEMARRQDPMLGATRMQRIQRLLPSSRTGRRAFLGGLLATPAMVALAVQPPLGLWPSLGELSADYRTGTGEQRQLAFSETVTVQMNTQTRINRKSGLTPDTGIVLVAGEAEIVVNNGQPLFTLDVGGGRLHTQSARFNVRHTGADVCVTCFSGQVDIMAANHQSTLVSGQQLVFDKSRMHAVVAVEKEDAPSWRSGALNFVDVPLAEVINEINRYRSGRVVLQNATLAQRQVRMRFTINQTESALRMISELYGAQLTKLPAGVVLLS